MDETTRTPAPAGPEPAQPHPFGELPEPVLVEDMVAEKDVTTAPDPEGGRSPNHEWMLRYG
jgi:hypothetical protein